MKPCAFFKEFRTLKGNQGIFGFSQRLQKGGTAYGVEEDPGSSSDGPAPRAYVADQPETWGERPSASADDEFQ
eukprot:11227104-Lingulodinium_polyedra.AAC.1